MTRLIVLPDDGGYVTVDVARVVRGDESEAEWAEKAGDLLLVPAGTRHRFDMGANPAFAAIRFSPIPERWVGEFTGDDIATRFASYDTLLAR